jgi:hypothetical protein
MCHLSSVLERLKKQKARVGPDVPHCKQFFDCSLGLILESLGVPIGRGDHQCSPCLQLTSMLELPVWWSPWWYWPKL